MTEKGGIPVKKLFFIVFLSFLLALSVPAFAESDHDEIIDSLIALTEMALGEGDFNDVTYNESLNSIIIKTGVSGFADTVQAMISYGLNASYEMWAEYKASTISFYESIAAFYEAADMNELGLVFIVVNDNVYIDKDASGMPSPFLLVIMDGEIRFDIIGELNGY